MSGQECFHQYCLPREWLPKHQDWLHELLLEISQRKSSKYIGFSISLCWILYIVVNSIFPLYIFTKWSSENLTEKWDYGYCTSALCNRITDSLCAMLFVFPHVVFSVLMIWSSGSMVLLLYRHEQQVQLIPSITVSPRFCLESGVTQRILVLVRTFLCLHTLSSLVSVSITLYFNPMHWFPWIFPRFFSWTMTPFNPASALGNINFLNS